MFGDVSSWLLVGIFTPSESGCISLMGTFMQREEHACSWIILFSKYL